MNKADYNKSVELFSDRVYRFILKNIKDEDKAKDIVQDAYEILWKNRNQVDIEKAKSYLFTTAYRKMIDGIRKDKKNSAMDNSAFNNYSHEDQYSDLNEILHEAISKLPETQRSVIMLRDYEGYSYEEICKITDLSESQVKVYIYRARVFLKKYIGKMELLV